MCVVYEEFGEMRHACGVERNEMVRGRGGWWVEALGDMVGEGGYFVVD